MDPTLAGYSKILKKVLAFSEGRNFSGYDIYDGLEMTDNRFLLNNYFFNSAITQFFKKSPFNFRPLAGVKQSTMPKAYGIFLSVYTGLMQLEKNGAHDSHYHEVAGRLFNWLQQHQVQGYSGACWNFGFRYKFMFEKPTVVITSVIAKALYEYFMVTGRPEAKSLLLSIRNFILEDLFITETAEGICFSYTPAKRDCCYNASMLAAETLARIYAVSGDRLLIPYITRAVDFTVAHQKEDGRWNYDLDVATGKEKKQVDFHQGYILESLSAIMELAGMDSPRYRSALEKGTRFYFTEQFFSDGRGKWRLPAEYPIDIHNQAQAVIYFSSLPDPGFTYLDFAKKVLDWTLRNMYSADGYFYYQVHKLYKIRIPYMRWSQAWMTLALTKFIAASASRHD